MKTIKFKIDPIHRVAGISRLLAMTTILFISLGLLGFKTHKQSFRILRGEVFSSLDNSPLPGVIITMRGYSQFTSSNKNGVFEYKIPDSVKEDSISFKSIGYKTKYIKANYSKAIKVFLDEDENRLGEVVVTGYSGEEKVDISGSVSEVRPKKYVDNYNNVAPNTGVLYLRGTARGIPLPNKTGYNPGFYNRKAQDNSYESYQEIKENGFLDPIEKPLSTFAVHVDGTSYSNLRRFLNQGQIPPKDAIRIEEMMNYFHYNTPGPENGDPVAIHTEVSEAPWNLNHPLVRISLKSKSIKTESLPAARLVFLLDVSGSMGEPNKLDLVKASMNLLVDQLRPIDEVAIVVYAGEAGLKLPMTSGDQKNKIKDVINSLNANGSTAGGAGLRMAYDIARKSEIKNSNTRIILATDGDFNVGESSDKDMEQLIEEEDKSGVKISILGFGMGNLKDSKMERMAYKGHGNYAYIDNILEAEKSMVNEFGGTLFTLAKDVKMQVEFNPDKVQAYRLIGYENRMLAKEDFNNDQKIGGDMGPGQETMALYEIIPVGQSNPFNSVDSLKYQSNFQRKIKGGSNELMTVKFRYKDPQAKTSKMIKAEVSNERKPLIQSSEDFRFSAAVAELGLLLRDSPYKQKSSFSNLIQLAKSAKGKDDEGYRSEFIRLAQSAQLLTSSGAGNNADSGNN